MKENPAGLVYRLRQFLTEESGWLSKRPQLWLLLCIFVLLLIQVYFALYGAGVLSKDTGCKLKDVGHTNTAETWLYNGFMNHRLRLGAAKRTALVTITEGSEPLSVITNTCAGRSYIAEIVQKLDELHAGVIAIDQSYSQDSCTDSAVNDRFRAALEGTHVPIVVGQRAHKRPDSIEDGDCLVADSEFDFMPADAPRTAQDKVHAGLVRLNGNTLKIPLQWYVFHDDRSSANHDDAPDATDGFAYVAATQADSNLKFNSNLIKLRAEGEHPYASFVKSIPAWTATDLLCDEKDPPATGEKKCQGKPPASSDFAGKVVVVGDHIDRELRPFPGEDQYGMNLHANYIESLLTGHYVETMSPWLDSGAVYLFVLTTIILQGINLRSPQTLPQMTVVRIIFGLFLALILVALLLLQYWSLYMPHLFLASISMGCTVITCFVYALQSKLSEGNKREEQKRI